MFRNPTPVPISGFNGQDLALDRFFAEHRRTRPSGPHAIIAEYRAVVDMDMIVGRSLMPLNSSRTLGSVRRGDDNSRGRVQNVRGDSSVKVPHPLSFLILLAVRWCEAETRPFGRGRQSSLRRTRLRRLKSVCSYSFLPRGSVCVSIDICLFTNYSC
jgi:hypothetical protein